MNGVAAGVAAGVRGQRVGLSLMAASGFAGLGYQVVWARQVAPWAGHEAAAVLVVVTAFFGGLAVGAFACGPAIERSRHPARWYVGCEALISVWAALLLVVIAPTGALVMDAIGVAPTPMRQWGVVFGATFLLFLPATAAMGATLPALERASSDVRVPRSLALPYACNTLGAVAGVLATTFWLVPALGFAATTVVCAAVNLACAGVAWRELARGPAVARVTRRTGGDSRGVLARLACTGFLGIGYEVLVVRVLSQVMEDTVYTFALLLAVYLAGTTAGAALYRRLRRSADDCDGLTIGLAAACLAGTATLWLSASWRDGLAEHLSGGMAAAVSIEALLALAAFALPTVGMGLLFAALCDRARRGGAAYGTALGWNLLGAAIAPCVFGVVLVPVIGPKAALLLVAAGYLATATTGIRARPAAWSIAAAVAAMAVATPPLAFVTVPAGGRVVSYADGISASVSVVEDADGVDRLRIDDRQQEGTSATAFVDGRQALLPLLLQATPHRALFLGFGTGVTASIAASVPDLDVDAVELLPEVIDASRRFVDRLTDGVPNARLHVVAADARRYVRASRTDYDVIVADNFHPARAGSGTLYTVEHFAAIRDRLAPAGLFCQWLPLHQLDLTTLRSIVGSFGAVYPRGFAILANNSLDTPVIGLVAVRDGALLDAVAVRDRVARSAIPRLSAFALDDGYAVLGSIAAGPASLARFASGAPLNRDDRPVVAYLAPRATYAPEAPPRRRLLAWLHDSAVDAGEAVDASREPAFAARLAAYRAARDRFIAVGDGVRPTADAADMLAQVEAPLLDVLRISPDFRPAFDPLMRMAAALRSSNPAGAAALLDELAVVRQKRSGAE